MWNTAARSQTEIREAESGEAPFPLQAALEEIGRAARDIAFAETADVIALGRIRLLRDMINACHDEAERAEDLHVTLELVAAIDGLSAELASFEDTLPLERAFRADQRDQALERIAAAQAGLRAFIANASQRADLFEPMLSRAEAVELAVTALARSPEDIATAARAEAEARFAENPLPLAKASGYTLSQPEGWTAWLAARIAERAGRAFPEI
ncbi:hypothetical protein [Rhodobacter maris]|uniref:Uncharacterized protein n=1 Tax=Rhodobacter maris TaxID=446682 RepID=A0A285T4Q0_9RHOB|nr:hypothetical protein [Rhodobacter maris]SOC16341.1 hypothetical protein SAMN05877831_11466 [Rhodobacter maris]